MKIKEIFFSFDIINKFVVNALNENINCNMYNIVNNLNQIDKKESKKQNFYINDIIEILDNKNNWNIKENNNPFIINKIDNFYSIVKNDFNDNNNINNNFHNKLNKIFIGSKNFEIKNNNNNININKNNNLNKSINYYINNNNNFNTINYDQNTKTIDINNKHKIQKNVKDSIKKNLSPVLNNLNKTKVFDFYDNKKDLFLIKKNNHSINNSHDNYNSKSSTLQSGNLSTLTTQNTNNYYNNISVINKERISINDEKNYINELKNKYKNDIKKYKLLKDKEKNKNINKNYKNIFINRNTINNNNNNKNNKNNIFNKLSPSKKIKKSKTPIKQINLKNFIFKEKPKNNEENMNKFKKYKDYCQNLSKKIAIENKRKKIHKKQNEISKLSKSFDDIITDNIQYNNNSDMNSINYKTFNFDKQNQNGLFEIIQNVNYINDLQINKNNKNNLDNNINNEKLLNIVKENSLESGSFATYFSDFSFKPKNK